MQPDREGLAGCNRTALGHQLGLRVGLLDGRRPGRQDQGKA